MVDTPTTRNRLRKQELGTNTNTWGDTKLNEVLDAVDQAMDGVESIALTGDKTLTTTNYTVADEAKNRVLKFTGSLAGAATVTLPSVEHEYNIINAAGATLTIKTAAGTGVDVPTGFQARVYCDAVNVYNGSPTLLPGAVTVGGKISGVTAGTAATDAVNKTQMETAIATAGIPAAAGTILISAGDTTAGYPGAKVQAFGTNIASIGNAGGAETLNIKPTAYTAGGTDTYTLTPSPAYTAYAGGMAFYVLFTNGNTGAATLNVNGLGAQAITKNGAAALSSGDIAAGSIKLVVYDGARFQMLPAAPTSISINQGTHSIPVPAVAMYANTTSGAEFSMSETATNKVMLPGFLFDASADEKVQFAIPMPPSWDEGTITVEFIWSAASASTNSVVWAAAAVALGDNDADDTAFGTAQSVTDANNGTGKHNISAATAAITVAGSPTAGDMVHVLLTRDADNGSDNLAADAKLLGVRVNVTINAATD